MPQKVKEHRIHYKLDQVTPINQYEMNAYNVPFAGNVSACRETYIRGEQVLEYTNAGDMTFEQLIVKPIFRDELVEYLFSFSKQLVSIVQNGLQLNKVVLDLKFIYARLSDFTVQIIYLPLDKNFPPQNVGDFMKRFLGKLVYAHTPAVECANQIVDYFDDHTDFDVFQFNSFIKDLRSSSQLLIIQNDISQSMASKSSPYGLTDIMRAQIAAMSWESPADESGSQAQSTATQMGGYSYRPVRNRQSMMPEEDSEAATVVLTSDTTPAYDVPVIVRKSTGEEIPINKQVFCIGKADQGVDYKVLGNKSISRRHAYITSINGVYYLRDNNSTNHTYLNGEQVYSNIDVVIQDNSIIKISNEEFLFRFGR